MDRKQVKVLARELARLHEHALELADEAQRLHEWIDAFPRLRSWLQTCPSGRSGRTLYTDISETPGLMYSVAAHVMEFPRQVRAHGQRPTGAGAVALLERMLETPPPPPTT